MFSSILSPGAIISTRQVKNQRLTVVKIFSLGHAACHWLSWNSIPDFLSPSSVLFTIGLGRKQILAGDVGGRRSFRRANTRYCYKNEFLLSF